MWYDTLIEKNTVPDLFLRKGIRKLLQQRLDEENKGDTEVQQAHLMSLINQLKTSPIAENTAEANTQHYEVPTSFYQYCLGKHLKYSCGYWQPGVNDLDTAESDMLELTCNRAELTNGMDVLELGCGWGSLSLYMSAKYPGSNFTVVSNSRTQKAYIDAQAADRGVTNLTVITADMNIFHTDQHFDRVVSVEMFEHMRNYQQLLKKVASFLKAEGKLFIHIFTHKEYTYLFEVKDESDWMSRYFFTGGVMPGDDLLFYFNDHLSVSEHWHVNGTHYGKTAEAWLRNIDHHKAEIMPLFEATYGKDQALKWWVYWRLFYMACAELWNYNKGNEWIVSHYLFRKNTV
ncbi:SAM-dependent methyltransferase [Chitinophaga sancti]|uniref:Cyclopropane-fatty-acyl-phospholipid synthase n=1 Tax=Chitinophaga sancti TaxID=1004 RepID=A0A1K1SU77_9BACT|nr:cyclopropane-fatty-acyl-phospholipid synthase family protein [Chitinophaga sancti]WQD60846.1 cyclopropane-fatty-acyl-phospholipid synthase family protein [Chitinophaga sancti]WQG87026.1 cyclopropane-fatty-acyl-phospholipid synthase family protein [Chitinophaga sancti]SFW87615.1 cyclopropane-fatty-acyl-phospholipid synthase [Chitinophaga sancti]